jgi:hypothetical protein
MLGAAASRAPGGGVRRYTALIARATAHLGRRSTRAAASFTLAPPCGRPSPTAVLVEAGMTGMETNFDPTPELRVLETLAKQHAPGSPEHAAVELAAKALLFLHATRQGRAFAEYLRDFHAELTDEQRRFLSSLGLA